MKPLKSNNNIFCDIKVYRNKKKGFLKALLKIASGTQFQGYVDLVIYRNGNFKKNIKYKERFYENGESYIDDFTKLKDELKTLDDLEELCMCLFRYGFTNELKKIKFDLFQEYMVKYKLLGE